MSVGIVILHTMATALAQSGVDLHAFQTVSNGARPGDYLRIWQPRHFDSQTWTASITYEYAEWSFLRYLESDGEVHEPLIDYLNTANLSGSVRLGRRAVLGLSAPIYLAALRASGETTRDIGDLRLSSPIHIWGSDNDTGSALSVIPALDLPTGNAERNLGTGIVRTGGWLAWGHGPTRGERGDWNFAANLGMMTSLTEPETTAGAPQLLLGAAGSYWLRDELAVAVEAHSAPSLSEAIPAPLDQPQEILLALRGGASDGGFGWVGGYARTLGTGNAAPLYRALFGLSWRPTMEVDTAPPVSTTAPVRLSVLDASGQPVRADVQLDGSTPIEAITLGESGRTEHALAFGPWRATITAPEYGTSVTDFIVEEDQEGLLEIQIILHQALVRIEENEIVILEQVHFDVDADQVLPESLPLLREVAAILLEHPEITKVEIQGHTDDQGEEAYNLDLSQRRVETVRNLLIVQGVDAERLEARGYGETQPIVDGQDAESRAANRRVQFMIVETQP